MLLRGENWLLPQVKIEPLSLGHADFQNSFTVVAYLFVVLYVPATMDSCHRVTGVAGGASLYCTRGRRRME